MAALRETWILLVVLAFLAGAYWRGARLGSALALGTFLGAVGRGWFEDRVSGESGESVIFGGLVSGVLIASVLSFALLAHWGRPTALGPWVRGKRALAFHTIVLLAGLEFGRELALLP